MGQKKFQVLEKEYTIENPAIPGEYKMSSSALLKFFIWVNHIDTNATTATIKLKLQSLDKHILTIACNVDKFNMHVNLILESISAKEETTKDLLNYLFRAYENVTNKEFVCYVKSKREKYEGGNTLSAPSLMTLISNKFKLLVEAGA